MSLKLLHLHLHGLIRSNNLELGRDADTGGQTLYVLELIKQLAASKEVQQVDLVTRQIFDRRISLDYSQKRERIVPGANILRIPFGPKRYLRKELLWPYLDQLVDELVDQLNQSKSKPDWIHAHYADAGYVGALVSTRLGIPFVFTGHSLGREKKRRLLESGMDHMQIENNYSISRRIEAEELALNKANLVVTSTSQEATYQYGRYRNFVSRQAKVIPPGVDLKRFYQPSESKNFSEIDNLFSNFLRNPNLPPLLTISRAVRRKNIPALVEAFGRSSILRKRHNLVLILGTRTDMRSLDKSQKEVFQQIFELVDKYELYGKVAYPKYHRRDQIASIYQWAAKKKGFFVNPALTEPFGLTLLEAAACGLPVIATDDGGPSEILSHCSNGVLVDSTDLDLLQKTLEEVGSNEFMWKQWSDNGLAGINSSFSWNSHVNKYLSLMSNQFKNSTYQSLAKVIPLSGMKAS
ncbi:MULTISPECIES: glycosyltransferase [unclassified Prochlorococcus]|uniref:glycosyltransferase n=1 Tax=unclassified Prochlorococcus TaxID=2627481 RepID=UPI00053378BF|nr:Sucrose phosphate synthase [Prochlorococcus sp. MIT 0602]KGG16073.1 Sucrose phosphate synthase [Prochlorococcus sp. MIT 0603]